MWDLGLLMLKRPPDADSPLDGLYVPGPATQIHRPTQQMIEVLTSVTACLSGG